MDNDKTLCQMWIEAKAMEKRATDERRRIEDNLLSLIGVSETFEGTENAEAGEYKIKITGRMNRKVDTERLQEVAKEHGVFEHLQSLFRWKAEINAAQWKLTDNAITEPLLEAITTTPGRPSFSIIRGE